MRRSASSAAFLTFFSIIGDICSGGASGDALMRVNMGNSYSLFPVYNRNGVQRSNSYVPIKGDKVQVLR